jgi:hypothetical protein
MFSYLYSVLYVIALLFRFAIALFVFLRLTTSDYPFGIFKHFLRLMIVFLLFGFLGTFIKMDMEWDNQICL